MMCMGAGGGVAIGTGHGSISISATRIITTTTITITRDTGIAAGTDIAGTAITDAGATGET